MKGSTILLVGAAAAIAYLTLTEDGKKILNPVSEGLGGIGGGGASGGDTLNLPPSQYKYTVQPQSDLIGTGEGYNVDGGLYGQVGASTPRISNGISSQQPRDDTYTYATGSTQVKSSGSLFDILQGQANLINREAFGGTPVIQLQSKDQGKTSSTFAVINPEVAKNLSKTQQQTILDLTFGDIIRDVSTPAYGRTPISGGLEFFSEGIQNFKYDSSSSSSKSASSKSAPSPNTQLQSNVINVPVQDYSQLQSKINYSEQQSRTSSTPRTDYSQLQSKAIGGMYSQLQSKAIGGMSRAPTTSTSSSSNVSGGSVPSSSNPQISRASDVSSIIKSTASIASAAATSNLNALSSSARALLASRR